MKSYNNLKEIFNRIGNVNGSMSILHWDFATMMPTGGAASRAEQFATLQEISHELLISEEVGDLIAETEGDIDSLDAVEWRNFELMKHNRKHATAVDTKLVTKLSILGTQCETVWREARKNNDFKTYEPYQQKVLEVVRKIAKAKSDAFGCSKYDALLDAYDPERTSEEIDVIFAELQKFLPNFTQNVIEHQKSRIKTVLPEGPFPAERQKELGLKLMEVLGFDFSHGRLDISHHPFCGGTSDDVRITTRYDEDDFTSAMMGVLHETGHALYEMGLPQEWRNQPIGEALGMSIHESQSLLMEMQVCRGKNFLNFAAPIIQEYLGDGSPQWSADNLYNLATQVRPGLIRVDADEVTYPIHVILRYNFEKALINEEINIKDIPDIWNREMKNMLGVDVISDADGCMQDVHWTDGAFGYFPTYTLGAMNAAQFFNAARKNPDIEYGIKNGDFSPLLKWLRENIHSHGSRYNTNDLLVKATGEGLNTDIYIQHLKNRYLS